MEFNSHTMKIALHYKLLFHTTILTLFLSGTGCQQNLQDESESKPNILVILTDDQGTIDLNCYGAEDLTTPNLDQLATSGIRFTQFYAGSAVCSPSRACLMTGRYPHFAGLPSNASSEKDHGRGMPGEQITMAEIFKSAGYQTGHVGKWHLGYTPEMMPNQQGFDYSFGHMGGCIDNYSHFFYWRGPNRHDLWRNGEEIWQDGEFFPDLMVDEVNQFIEKNQSSPWFLYWAINVPHYPLQGTKKWRDHYQDLSSTRNKYAAFVSTMDEKIGEVLENLSDLGLTENTIVVFQSDHGHSVEERTFGGGGNAGPYRGAKTSLFEGGIRVPAIISWPDQIEGNQTRNQLVTSADWLPTLVDLAVIEPLQHQINGKSIVSVLNSEDAISPHNYFHWAMGNDQWAVRKGEWKLIGHPRDPTQEVMLTGSDTLFLVNLDQDPGEKKNIREYHPGKTQELLEIHHQWLNQYQNN